MHHIDLPILYKMYALLPGSEVSDTLGKLIYLPDLVMIISVPRS